MTRLLDHLTFDNLVSEFAVTIRQTQREGDVPAGLDARRSGMMLLAVIRGMEAMAKGGSSSHSQDDRAWCALIAERPRITAFNFSSITVIQGSCIDVT